MNWDLQGDFHLEFLGLKLVQCGVMSEAEEIAFLQTSEGICLEFFGGHTWLFDEVLKGLTTSQALSERAECLMFALRNLVAAQDCRFTLEFRENRGLGWDDRNLLKLETKSLLGPAFRLCFTTPARKKSWFRPTVCSGLGNILATRCYTCPVKLTLDRRPMNGPAHDPCAGLAHESKAPFALRCWNDAEVLTPSILRGGPHWFVQKYKFQLALESDWRTPHEEYLKGILFAFLTADVKGRPQPSYVIWTHHGVIVKREEVPAVGSIGVSVLVCADEHSTDRFGLALGEGALYARQRWEAVSLARGALLELEECVESFGIVLKRADSFYASTWNLFSSWTDEPQECLEKQTETARQDLLSLACDFWNS